MSSGRETVTVSVEALRSFYEEAAQRMGLPEDDARVVADVWLHADLWGLPFQGSVNLPVYVRMVRTGSINPRPRISTVREEGATAVMEGDRGFGQLVGVRAMETATQKAKVYGVGAVTVRNSNHFGAAAYFALQAAAQNMIGLVTTNAAPRMAPWGGLTPVVSNNPVSIAVPTGQELPMVLDMAHCVAAGGKMIVASLKGEAIPPGWATDEEGKPTTDPKVALERGLWAPIGGPKGFGQALMMEVLSGVLSGGAVTKEISVAKGCSEGSSHFCLAVDVARFVPLDYFYQRVNGLIQDVHNSRKAPGVERTYIPGEIEFERKKRALAQGILMEDFVLRELETAAESLGMETRFR